MFVFIRSDGVYTVGFYKPGGAWVAVKDFDTQEEAEKHCHYLNGGNAEE